jgi:hypothetical protein
MGPQLSLPALVANDPTPRHAVFRVWTATAALTASGIAHLAVAATSGGSALVQVGALAAALAQFAGAGFLACLAVTGQRPSDAVAGLLLVGTIVLVAADLVAASGIAAAGAALAGLLVALSGAALLSGVRRRRAEDVLMGLGALVWLLWLVGVPG